MSIPFYELHHIRVNYLQSGTSCHAPILSALAALRPKSCDFRTVPDYENLNQERNHSRPANGKLVIVSQDICPQAGQGSPRLRTRQDDALTAQRLLDEKIVFGGKKLFSKRIL